MKTQTSCARSAESSLFRFNCGYEVGRSRYRGGCSGVSESVSVPSGAGTIPGLGAAVTYTEPAQVPWGRKDHAALTKRWRLSNMPVPVGHLVGLIVGSSCM